MSYALDDIAYFEERIPNGTYPVRIIDIDSHTTQAGDPMLKVTLEVTSGDHEGSEIQKMYYLKPNAKGNVFGLMELKRDAIALGVYNKLPKHVEADPAALKKPYATAFGKERFEVVVTEEASRKDPEKVFQKITFQAKKSRSSASEHDLSDMIG